MAAPIERSVGARSDPVVPEQRNGQAADANAAGKTPHPTARADGRPPTTRAADTALAAAMNAPIEALELLDIRGRTAKRPPHQGERPCSAPS